MHARWWQRYFCYTEGVKYSGFPLNPRLRWLRPRDSGLHPLGLTTWNPIIGPYPVKQSLGPHFLGRT